MSVVLTESISILCNKSNRKVANASHENPYIYATNHFDGQGPQRSHDCLPRFAKECNAKYPQTFTATSLSNQIATLSQLLNLKNHELKQLAHHLGHDLYTDNTTDYATFPLSLSVPKLSHPELVPHPPRKPRESKQ